MVENSRAVGPVVEAIRAGGVVVIPTDTVYGLACSAESAEAVRRLCALKGRDEGKPVALLSPSVQAVLGALPELKGGGIERVLRSLLPGPYTFVVPNAAERWPWLNPSRPDTVGVRVPAVEGGARAVLDAVGVLAASSANLAGEAAPHSVSAIVPVLRSSVDAILDEGELPGLASTVVDLTADEPRILRAGAVSEEEALAAVRAAWQRH